MADKSPTLFKIEGWRKKHRHVLQTCALAAGVLAPFGIFFALTGGLGWLAGIFFALLASAMLLTVWAG